MNLQIQSNRYFYRGVVRLVLVLPFTIIAFLLFQQAYLVLPNTTWQGIVGIIAAFTALNLFVMGIYYMIPLRDDSPWNSSMRWNFIAFLQYDEFNGVAFQYAFTSAASFLAIGSIFVWAYLPYINDPVVASTVGRYVPSHIDRGKTQYYNVTYTYSVNGTTYTGNQDTTTTKPQNVAYNPQDPSDSVVIGVSKTVPDVIKFTALLYGIGAILIIGFFYLIGAKGPRREHGPVQEGLIDKFLVARGIF